MYEFLKNLSDKSPCQSMGICSIDPTVSAIEELILSQIRETSFYVIKLRELGHTNSSIEERIIKALSIIMINTSFDHGDFINFLNKLCEDKKCAKEKYIEICRKNHLSCELIGLDEDSCTHKSVNSLINIGEIKIQNKYRGTTEEKQRLFELITLFAKTSAITLELLKKIQTDTSFYTFEIIRFFSLTNSLSTRCEKLKRRILEFSKISFELQSETNSAYEELFGKRQSAKILLTPQSGKAILVSGPDLFELEKLLETIGERKINVYTNSLMFIAHTYPGLARFKNLKGTLGTSNAQIDFANFPGAILITQNFIQKIDTLLRGTVYSNKIIAPNRVFKIKNNDYEPLIRAALNLEGFSKAQTPEYLEISHDFSMIENTLTELQGENVVIVVGENSLSEPILDFNGKKIINLDCPIETDLLIQTLNKCKNLNIKTDLFFTSCTLGSINTLMSVLFMDLAGIYLTDCSSALVNPHVLEALEKDFNVKIIR